MFFDDSTWVKDVPIIIKKIKKMITFDFSLCFIIIQCFNILLDINVYWKIRLIYWVFNNEIGEPFVYYLKLKVLKSYLTPFFIILQIYETTT